MTLPSYKRTTSLKHRQEVNISGCQVYSLGGGSGRKPSCSGLPYSHRPALTMDEVHKAVWCCAVQA